ncbi:hypothetical protein SDC9_161244 [bioreactor metagenome]|uniref:DUF1559 domain-containing protein n=1 Tax=bioreactor metagenome TaxID=1076179 RepID=A0A645FHP2_9ZZZZ
MISIIAILAAMLLPALSQAREKARQTACLSSLKQIGMGFQFYERDNNSFLPPSFRTSPNRWWFSYLNIYCGLQEGDGYLKTKLWQCDGASDGKYGYSLPKIAGNPPYSRGYSWNTYSSWNPNTSVPIPENRTARILKPHTIIIYDSNWYANDINRTPVVGWHNLRCNILYYDGSVGSEHQALLNDWAASKEKYWSNK